MRLGAWGVTALACASLLVGACGDDGQQREAREQSERTREIMREIYAGIRVALPASVNDDTFRDPTQRTRIAAALDVLARNADLLEAHTRRGEAEMRFLARSVARDAREVRRKFARKRYDRAAFLLRQITENCVACHTRLPSPEDSPLGKGFLQEEDLQDLAAEPRASLQIATRRFDDALDTLEDLLGSTEEHPAMLLGPLTDYLVVNIRVKHDFERPVPTLKRFAERPGVWTRLRSDLEKWIAALPSLRARAQNAPTLATARALLDDGRNLELVAGDSSGLVHFIVASSILEEIIANPSTSRRDRAEAYYLRGLIEARIGRNYWVTPAPFLLETSIRLAPGERFARDAYGLLEREILLDYEGSSEEEIPAEESARLAELKALIDRR